MKIKSLQNRLCMHVIMFSSWSVFENSRNLDSNEYRLDDKVRRAVGFTILSNVTDLVNC